MAHWRIWWWLLSATIREAWEGVCTWSCRRAQRLQRSLTRTSCFCVYVKFFVFYLWWGLLTSKSSFLVQSEETAHPWCPVFTFPPFWLLSWASPGFNYRLLPVDLSLCAPLHLCQTLFFTTASVWNHKHLHVSSDYCSYSDEKSSFRHHEDQILFIPESGQTAVLHSTGLSPFRQRLLLLIST